MIALLVALLAAAGAEPPGTLEELLRAATRARDEGRLEESLVLLERAYELLPSHRLLHNRARLLEELGRYQEAAQLYRRVIQDPETPGGLRADDAARLAALEPELGRAELELSLPAEASALVDGRPAAPRTRLEPGRRLLEVRAGPRLLALELELPAGRRVRWAPPAAPACLELDAPGEALSLDGAALRGVLRGELRELCLLPGRHELELLRDGQPQVARRDLAPGERLTLSALFPPLRPPPAVVRAEPGLSWTALSLGTVSVGLAIGAGVLYAQAASRRDVVQSAAREGEVIVGLSMRRAAELEDGAVHRTTLANAALGGAAGLGLTALLLAAAGAP